MCNPFKEYESGHLANSINIDWNGSDFDQQISKLGSKEETVYIIASVEDEVILPPEENANKGIHSV